MREQFGPASGAGVPRRDSGNRQRPVDRQIRIVESDGKVLGWVMRAIDPVAYVGRGAQRLKPVQKPRWHIQVPKAAVVQEECLLSSEGRRVLSDVDEYVVHGTVGAAHEFGLTPARPAVHAADDAPGRTRLRILHERCGATRSILIFVEDIRVERSGEQAAMITKGLRDKDDHVGEFGVLDAHIEMVS